MTAADLFVLIDREFRRRRPRECGACYVPLPYRVDEPGAEAGNWEIITPSSCGWRCDLVLDEIVGEFQQKYRLETNGKDRHEAG